MRRCYSALMLAKRARKQNNDAAMTKHVAVL